MMTSSSSFPNNNNNSAGKINEADDVDDEEPRLTDITTMMMDVEKPMVDNDDDTTNDDTFQDEYDSRYAGNKAVVLKGGNDDDDILPQTTMTKIPPSATTATAASFTTTTEERLGHSCCGCCCDMRRAVIIVNIINIIFSVLASISFAFATSDASIEEATSAYETGEYDDDTYVQELQDAKNYAVEYYLLTVMGIICMGIGILGAIRFRPWMIGCATIVYCISCGISLVFLNVIGAIIAALYAYPHFVLLQEIRQGIMSMERYPHEEQSCCCV